MPVHADYREMRGNPQGIVAGGEDGALAIPSEAAKTAVGRPAAEPRRLRATRTGALDGEPAEANHSGMANRLRQPQ